MYNALTFDNLNSNEKLYVLNEEGAYNEATSSQILATARNVADQLLMSKQPLNNPDLVKNFLVGKLAGLEHEVAAIIFLDSQFQLIRYIEMFHGTLSQASVYPREIAKVALRLNASAVIMSHNHPSGHAEPSMADRKLTKNLQKSLGLLDIKLLDHILVAGASSLSFTEAGHL